jgi:general secretion pathway protein A
MYNEFYHFREKPFALTPDPEFLYRSRSHKRALAYLEYGIQDPSGFVCITGEIGAGKTTLIRTFLNQINEQVKVARLFNTKVTSRQLLEMILQDLGLECQGKTKTEMIETLNNCLIETFAEGKRVVLIIDEAQNLSVDLLEEIRLLSNLETEKTKLLQIILVGQSELRDQLQLPNLEQFRQRITVNYHIPPLDRAETAAYIRHRIHVASEIPVIEMPEQVLDIIHKYSSGVPRLINVICDALLLYGFVEDQREPDEDMIRDVIKDMVNEGTLRHPAHKNRERLNGSSEEDPASKELKVLKERVKSLEQKQALFKKALQDLMEKNQSFEDKDVELFNRLEEIHEREQVLAVEQEKLKSKEAELIKRERSVRELLFRVRAEQTPEKIKTKGKEYGI